MRPSDPGTFSSAVTTATSALLSLNSEIIFARSDASTSGVSPLKIKTVPCIEAGSADMTASAVPFCSFCENATAPKGSITRRTSDSPWPTTTRSSRAPQALAAFKTRPTIGRPTTGCKTFGSGDFIRVPLPAARTITDKLDVVEFPGASFSVGAFFEIFFDI